MSALQVALTVWSVPPLRAVCVVCNAFQVPQKTNRFRGCRSSEAPRFNYKKVLKMTRKDFKNVVSEYIDTMVEHLIYTAEEENVPTTETDMLKIVEVITRMKIEGVE